MLKLEFNGLDWVAARRYGRLQFLEFYGASWFLDHFVTAEVRSHSAKVVQYILFIIIEPL